MELVDRQHPRADVQWQSHCSLGMDFVVGEVRDVSKRGLFFVPEAGLADGTLMYPGQLPPGFEVGDKLSVGIEARVGRTVTVSGEIRWMGYSPRYRRYGFGIELERDAPELTLPAN